MAEYLLEIAQRTGAEITEAIERIGGPRSVGRGCGGGEAQGMAQSWIEDPESALNESEKRWLRPLRPDVESSVIVVLYWINYALMRTLFRLRYSGLENLPARGPFIIAPNHTSFLDPVALAAGLALGCSDAHCGQAGLGSSSRVRSPSPGTAGSGGADRPSPGRRLQSCSGCGGVEARYGAGLVPEGQRSPDGSLQPFRAGLGLLLQHFPVPVVPVVIEGAYAAWPRHRRTPAIRPDRRSHLSARRSAAPGAAILERSAVTAHRR